MKVPHKAATMLFLTAVAASTLGAAATLPARAAEPFGTWLVQDKDGEIRITNCGGALCGTLAWMKEPNDPETGRPKTDKNNPDPTKRDRPMLGVLIILGMKPSGPNVWSGEVYNSRDGHTYSGSFTLTGDDTAALKGCVLGGLICQSQNWTRVK